MHSLLAFLRTYHLHPRGAGIAYLIIALFGAGLAFLVVNRLGGSDVIIRPLGAYDFWVIFSGALGAILGVISSRKWFGKKGMSGVMNVAVGVPLISFLAAIYAGTLALPVYGTMFGPLALAVTFYESPLLMIMWGWTLLCVHLIFLKMDNRLAPAS